MKKSKINKLSYLSIFILSITMGIATLKAQSETHKVDSFDEVTISPYIEVTFKKGDTESVIIEETDLPMDKFNIEVKSGKLHLFIDDTKITSPTKKVKKNGGTMKVPIYTKTMVKATVIYKDVDVFSLRGEEKFNFKSPIKKNKIKFNIYGESQTFIDEVDINDLKVTIYGESYLEIKKGTIKKQRFTAYGESQVNTLGSTSETTKITAYGEGSYKFNISELLKVTAYGEAYVGYKGKPKVRKGLIFGGTVRKID